MLKQRVGKKDGNEKRSECVGSGEALVLVMVVNMIFISATVSSLPLRSLRLFEDGDGGVSHPSVTSSWPDLTSALMLPPPHQPGVEVSSPLLPFVCLLSCSIRCWPISSLLSEGFFIQPESDWVKKSTGWIRGCKQITLMAFPIQWKQNIGVSWSKDGIIPHPENQIHVSLHVFHLSWSLDTAVSRITAWWSSRGCSLCRLWTASCWWSRLKETSSSALTPSRITWASIRYSLIMHHVSVLVVKPLILVLFVWKQSL